MGLKKTEQKEYAKYLFTEKNLTQKEIADKAGVTEKTLKKWIDENEGAWKKLKKSLMTTKSKQIENLYNQIEILNNIIATRKIIYDIPAHLLKPVKVKDNKGNETLKLPDIDETEFPIKVGNYATSKESDTITKLTNSIQKLEGEMSLGETVQTGMAFIEFVRDVDFVKAQELSELFDMFIRQQLQ